MKTVKSLALQRFGRLLVVCRAGQSQTPNGTSVIWWLCKCDCGNLVKIRGSNLRAGNTVSCGCYRAEVEKVAAKTHGRTGSPEYESWRGMRERCTNPKNKRFKDYGGRGIKVCDRWGQFENFYADMGVRPIGKTLDRKDNDGDYEPSNCCWATDAEQRANKVRKIHGTG